jgi:hypothetical protein
VRNLKKNVKRKKNHENNPCTLTIPTKNRERKPKLISVRVKILRLHVRIICHLTISIKCLRNVTMSSRVHRVDHIRGVPISISLGGQTGRLENLPRLFFIFVEEVAQICNHCDINPRTIGLGARFVEGWTSYSEGAWVTPGSSRMVALSRPLAAGWRS